MTQPALRLAGALYDRTRAIATGGAFDYRVVPGAPAALKVLEAGEVDAAEVSVCRYLIDAAAGRSPYVAVGVFPSKMFRHHSIYVHSGRVRGPADLAGATIGAPGFALSAPVWIRGFLRDDFGVDLSGVTWADGPINTGPDPLARQLAEGRVDALFSAERPDTLGQGAVARLFPDFRTAERDWFVRTGLFPIMHTIAVRRELATQALADALHAAYAAATAQAMADLRRQTGLRVSLPWLYADLEEMDALGPDLWAHGLNDPVNAPTLAALLRHLHEDGLIPDAAPPLSALFPFG